MENLALEERMKQDALNFNYFDESITTGALHPVMSTMDKIIEYFIALNFSIEKGPLIEDDFHNFEALICLNLTLQEICKIPFILMIKGF